ncbi:hypothetical protein LSTR_LSTR017309 [Laodelphax striatellus]|uniref:Secreted protein n=1 Tax=Laodelphax striatellus TaxID=195883 RepID=A0A482XQ86_LAOST|nr:hypothetical protein LSTR_LSTR017309 [Laodelphax striatellus]
MFIYEVFFIIFACTVSYGSHGRVSFGQGNSLSLFSSKEQEYEQRAQLLKRLAFVILCSERDQFHKHTPDILGFILLTCYFACTNRAQSIACPQHTHSRSSSMCSMTCTISETMIGQSEVTWWGDMRSSSTRKHRNTCACTRAPLAVNAGFPLAALQAD